MDSLVSKQDYARNILAGAQLDLEDYQNASEQERLTKHKAGAEVLIEKQDYARDILAGAQEDLEGFQEEHKKKSAGIDFTKIGKAGMRGDIPGMLEGAGIPEDAIAGALPAVGAGLMVKAINDKINKAIIDGIKSSIGTAGNIATSIATVNQDVTAPIAQLGDAASKAGEKIDEYVPIIGKFGIIAGESAKALAQMMQAVDATAKHYSQYNADLAAASTQAEVRQTMRDISRSQLLGPRLSEYVTAKSKLENDVEDMKAAILNELMPTLNLVVEGLGDFVKFAGPTLAQSTKIALAVSGITPITGMIKEVRDYFKGKEEEVKSPTDYLFELNKWFIDDTQGEP